MGSRLTARVLSSKFLHGTIGKYEFCKCDTHTYVGFEVVILNQSSNAIYPRVLFEQMN